MPRGQWIVLCVRACGQVKCGKAASGGEPGTVTPAGELRHPPRQHVLELKNNILQADEVVDGNTPPSFLEKSAGSRLIEHQQAATAVYIWPRDRQFGFLATNLSDRTGSRALYNRQQMG